jgi:ubiquinone/menaquinone biosynthesis C-methylase UbiE
MQSRDHDAYFTTRLKPVPARDRLWPILTRYLQDRFVPENSAVVDIGAGYCHFINNIRAREKHAVDISQAPLNHAARDVITHVSSCEYMPDLESRHFDFVFASNLLEHLERDQFVRTLGEVRRVLKPGGRFLIIQPNFRYCYRAYFDDYTHRQVFTDRSLSDSLAAEEFEVRKVIPRFLPYSVVTVPVDWAWLLKLYLRSPFRPFAGQMLILAEAGSTPKEGG